MPTTARKMEKLILKHGFKLVRSRGSHRQYEDSHGRRVTIAFHPGDLPRRTEISILKQAGLK